MASTNKLKHQGTLPKFLIRNLSTKMVLGFLLATSTVSALAPIPREYLSTTWQENTHCATSSPASAEYTATICLALQDSKETASGTISVTGTLDVSGTVPGVRTVAFYLDGEYLLTDFEAPYTFELPTDHFADGPHRLSVDALLRDTVVTDQATIDLEFKNGLTTPPVNTNVFTPSEGRPAGEHEPYIVAVVGDGAGGQHEAAQVVELIASWNPNLFLYLGDVYGKGTYTEFLNWYGDETHLFGRFRAITNPIIGDHEYTGREAPGYYYYWDNIPDYYSFDAAGWHFISLNSTTQFGQRSPGSPQYDWLLQDLSATKSQCTIAYLHQPVFSIGKHGGDDRLMDIWALLAQHGVEMTLSGNDHDYQRWQALDAAGRPDPDGTTPFVVGTGGQGIRVDPGTDQRLAKGYNASSGMPVFGALNLKLNPLGLEYRFVNIAGAILDSGVIGCETSRSDTTAPSSPAGVNSTLDPAGHIILNWSQAEDDTGVAGYIVYRDGEILTALDGAASGYTDASTQIDTTYSYTLKAFDLANNMSASSEVLTATTLSTVTLTLTPVADAFVDESASDTNYGDSRKLRTDSTPAVQIYLRFDVPELAGNVSVATLRLYATSASNSGHDVYAVSQNDWDEANISYSLAPELEHLIVSSGPFEGDTWVSVDVTSLITGEGPLSLALTTTSTTNTTYSSKEGTNPPELIIELANN